MLEIISYMVITFMFVVLFVQEFWKSASDVECASKTEKRSY